jgi:3',5'-cyclic AMP phosphodiesterase CpdA
MACAAMPGTASEDRSSPRFYFVQISDCHFGNGAHAARMRDIVDRVNALPMPIACAVVTGDLTSDNITKAATLTAAAGAFARIKVPVHYLPGNHDIQVKHVEATVNAYTNAFGPLASQAEYNGVEFLMLYTEPLRRPIRIAGYDPLAWLQAAIKTAGTKPVLVFHHTPPFEDFYDNQMHPGWPRAAREQWDRLIQSANVKAVIAGHFHRDELHWSGSVPCFVASSVAGYWGRQGSFRLYEYDRGTVSYRTVYLEQP